MNSNHYRSIEGAPSLFLDALRFGASLVVFFYHARGIWFPDEVPNAKLPGDEAHTAVVVFFVLSGYVISYTTVNRNKGALKYFQARLGRLYSVLLPGLLFSIFVEFCLYYVNPPIYQQCTRGNTLVRYVLTSSFLNEIWFFSAAPPINGPLWSLSYEFWYYVIFGLWVYAQSTWKAKLASLIACLIAGPKILLMMPIWLMGVYAYKIPAPSLNKNLAWGIIILLAFILGILYQWLPPYPAQLGYAPLFFSAQFLTDYILGIVVALSLWILPEGRELDLPKKSLQIFRDVADLTFPIYVLHNPLLHLFRGVFGYLENNQKQLNQAMGTVILLCAIIGYFLNKYRPYWVLFFGRILKYLKLKGIVKARILQAH
ncbi:acyltransferase [Runella sp. MFBS21]|uniref:acyltransferase family protein n=1 Tax=Runella sp. MFBS21 TaxID=3034018 RepID=UPI0023F64003|nr:acyltransferase [Runella sp. MFBS21]MDF7820399.1 acyltransferase [Runella sp. MFBS21]